MSDLANQTPASTYKGLLQVGDYTNGVDSTVKAVLDGEGTASALAIGTTKVGVGTASPSQELDVSGNVVADEYALDQTGSSSSAVAIHAPATNELAIRTNSTERLRIDSSGNVGINTDNPLRIIDIQITDATAYAGNGGGNALRVINTSQAADTFSSLEMYAGQTSEGDANIARIFAVKESTTSTATSLAFQTRASNEVLSEAMRIDSEGKVGIGTTSPAAPLEVASTTGGVIMPRMTTTQRTAISSPTPGEMVYDTDLNKFYGYTSSGWTALH